MRSIEENEVVHKSDYDFNPKVLDAIALAKLTKNPRDYIDCMYGGKDLRDIRETNEEKRNGSRKVDLSQDREEMEH